MIMKRCPSLEVAFATMALVGDASTGVQMILLSFVQLPLKLNIINFIKIEPRSSGI